MILKKIAEYKIKKETERYQKAGVMRTFHYDFGSMGEGVSSYTISEADGVLCLIYQKKSMEDGSEDRKEYILPLTVMQQLKKIIADEKIFLWNGFNKSNSVIATGRSFNLVAGFDNYRLKASGMVMMPTNYAGGHEALESFFTKIMESAE